VAVVGDELAQNAILAALDDGELERLRGMLELVDVGLKEPVYEYRGPIGDVYFPISAVFSMVALADDRIVVEVSTIGYEGIVGLPLFLGATSSPTAAFCQIPGRAARMSAADLTEFLGIDGQLHSLLHRYTHTTMAQMSQNVVCNSTHTAEQRAARWLLTTGDRVRSDRFPLTQEFLAQMLGVRRPTVSEIAGKLQADGLISYSRGTITITDRTRLTDTACDCYRIIKAEFDALPEHRP
jgi:CRP-like cAMP-binding protein